MVRPGRRFWLLVLTLLALCVPMTAQASPATQTIGHGGVVQLAGTQHLFVSDGGTLHWAADTRALVGRTINWGERYTVDVATLRQYPMGDPWLSAGLLKWGDPIYLAKWETNECCPRLLHIQSIGDVELFGINAGNYGRFVIEQGEWDRRTGFNAPTLARATLERAAAAATTTPRPLPTATPRPLPTSTVRRIPPTATTGPTCDPTMTWDSYLILIQISMLTAVSPQPLPPCASGSSAPQAAPRPQVSAPPAVGTGPVSLATLNGNARVVASDGTYLGKVTSNQFDSESIINDFGNYGSKFSSTSINNEFGSYGGQFSSMSPFNRFTASPPRLVLNDGRWLYLSTNSTLSGVDPGILLAYLRSQ
jgi:hypothetical protein